MSIWINYNIEERLRAILAAQSVNHHFGSHLFITAYQLAIEFERNHPKDFAAIGMPIGGEGTGTPNSFSQYTARELSQRIKAGSITDIEGSFLGNLNLHEITFDSPSGLVTSSLTGSQYPVSIYRLRD